MKHLLKQHFQAHQILYIILLVCFITGLFIGQVQVQQLDFVRTSELQQWILQAASFYTIHPAEEKTLFLAALKQQCQSIFLIWFAGMTLIGAPLVLGWVFCRGIALGFTFHFLFSLHHWKGLGSFFLSILPQNLIYIPCLFIWSVLALNLSFNIIKKKKQQRFSSMFLQYQLLLPLFLLFTALGALLESWMSPYLLRFFPS